MIINNSRQHNFDTCKTLAYNWDQLNLGTRFTAPALLVGGGFHKGIALINAKKGSLDEAALAGEADYRERLGNWDLLLNEEKAIHETEIVMTRSMIRAYGEHYINEQYEVLAPEIKFLVPLPNSIHHCYYIHRILYGDNEFTRSIDELGNIPSIGNSCNDERCRIPHHISGTADAILQWNRMIWLQEHKTTAYDLYNNSAQSRNWINNWMLNNQATCYIYGIWKSVGIQAHGVLLNAVIKPRKNAANPVFNFYREGFLRTTEQLLQYEKEITQVAIDYEYRMRTGTIWKNPYACFNYNRKCDYYDSCVSGSINKDAYIERSMDYVQANYYKLLGMEPPSIIKEEVKVIE